MPDDPRHEMAFCKALGNLPVVPVDPELTDNQRYQLVEALARGIYGTDEIAKRFSFGRREVLLEWLDRHPTIVRQVEERRAAWLSEANIEVRNRVHANVALGEAIIVIGADACNPNLPPASRAEAAKLLTKIAGLDGPGQGARTDQKGGGAGASFTLNIQFGGGARQTIQATTIEGIAEPASVPFEMPKIGDAE